MKPGARVGAVMSEEKGIVEFLGYGIYCGDEIPPKGIMFLGQDLHDLEHKNPKILLDNGDVVWGCECWWGDEEAVRKVLEGKKVEIVKIDICRAEAKKYWDSKKEVLNG